MAQSPSSSMSANKLFNLSTLEENASIRSAPAERLYSLAILAMNAEISEVGMVPISGIPSGAVVIAALPREMESAKNSAAQPR